VSLSPAPGAAIFDFDGVLIDSRAAVAVAVNDALVEHGYARRPAGTLDFVIGPPVTTAFAELTGAPPGSASVAAAVATYHEHYAAVYLDATRLVDGIGEALDALTLPLALATSKPVDFVAPLLDRLGIARHFPLVCAPALTALDEPKALLVARALDALGARDAVVVGDRSFDVEGAHANGLRAIGVTWGIGDAHELEAAGADVVVAHPRELPPLLEGR